MKVGTGEVVSVFENNIFMGTVALWNKIARRGGDLNSKGVYEWTELWEGVYITGPRKGQKHTKDDPLVLTLPGEDPE